jgi:hypothetical protein
MLQTGRSRVRDLISLTNFSSVCLILSTALGPEVYSISNRNEYQRLKCLGSKSRPERKADNLTAICEPIVQTMWDP